jgi:positive regulator of sigma E activity
VGTVVEVSGAEAVVRLDHEQCGHSGFQCACSAAIRPEPRTVRVERGDLEEGDAVAVSAPAYLEQVSTVTVFVLPLVLAVGGAALGMVLGSESGTHDMAPLIGAAAGFALALVAATVVNRALSRPGLLRVHRIRQGGH